jgi:peptidoglycan hydrolase-like amidase
MGLKRADLLIDTVTRESIMRESQKRRQLAEKKKFVINGGGFGRGLGMSHPLMDYRSLNSRQIKKIKQTLLDREQVDT